MTILKFTRALALFLTIAVLIPATALAAEPSFVSQIKSFRLTDLLGRDSEASDKETLPAYSYQSGSALAMASPITEEGDWPKPVVATKVAPRVKTLPPLTLAATGDAAVVLEGEASYYSRAGCLGCDPAMIMANGQTLDDNALTMAIGANLKHLVGRPAKVTSLATGKSVTVRITDTGGFYQAKYGYRVADLTIATKNAIGMAGGVGQVRVEVF